MSFEAAATLILLVLTSVVLAVVDVAVAGILHLAAGVAFRKAFCWGLLALLLPPLVMGWGALIERNNFRVVPVELKFDSLPEGFDGYRIIHISDIHSRSFEGRTRQLGKAVDKINALDADLVAFSGDIITMSPDELDVTTPVLSQIKARDGVVSVLGNHDYGIYARRTNPQAPDEDSCIRQVAAKTRAMGWNILLDRNVILKRGTDSIAVIGVENTTPSPHFNSRGNLAKASEGTRGMFRVLLSHDPMHWDAEVVGQDYPLTLSGHTHAMQFSLLGWCPSKYMFKQYRGLYASGKQYLYVNIGLGETMFPARIGTAPEITVITLRR